MNPTQCVHAGFTALAVWFLPFGGLAAQDTKEIEAACGQDETSYPIDMRGAGTETSRFPRERRVCVVVFNMNPFTTVYRVRTTLASYPQDALADIPKALGVTVPKPPAPTLGTIVIGEINSLGITPQSPAEGSGKAPSEACTRLDSFRRQLEFVQQQRQALAKDLGTAGRALAGIGAAADSLYQPDLDAARLLALTKAFVASFPPALETPLVGGFTTRANGLETASATLVQQALQGQRDGTCADIESAVTNLAITLAADLPAAARRAVATDEAIAEMTAIRTLALAVVRDSRVLRHTFWIGDFDSPSYVDIVVRTAPKPPAESKDTLWRTERSPRLHFGDRRQFAVLGGVSFGAERVAQSFQVVRTANDSDSRRIELKEETVPIAPMIYASVALARSSKLSLTAIGGVGPTFTESIKAVLFVGAGVGLADDRVFLMVGGLSAPRTSLTGGYDEGDILPDTQESVPVKIDRKLKVAFGVAVRPF